MADCRWTDTELVMVEKVVVDDGGRMVMVGRTFALDITELGFQMVLA